MIAIKQPQLAAGQFHNHGLDGGGRIWSWGYAGNGSLGVGKSWDDRLLPEIVENIGLVTALSSSFNHTVALDMSGAVWTWGYIVDGYLGDGSDNTKQWAPVQVRDNGGYLENVVKVAAGWSHSVALKKDGTVWTWGRDHYGQLGNGQQGSGIIAEQVTGLADIVSVSAGGDFTLALDSGGKVWGWGANWSGCLGIGTTTRWSTPVQIPNLPKITAVAAGAYHSLLLDASERVWASGRNDYGQLGKGSEGDSLSFTLIGLESIVAISAGASHSLALGRDGKVRAWGRNSFGQCGGESENPQMSPILVVGIDKVARIETGSNHSLALREDGSIWTWGRNNYGQLGNGAKDESGSFNPVPAEISFRLFGTPGGGGLTNGYADAEVHPVGPQTPLTSEKSYVNWIAIQAQESGLYRVTMECQREYAQTSLAIYKLVETEEGSKLRLVGNHSNSLLALSQGDIRYIVAGIELQPDSVHGTGWHSLHISYAGKAAPDVKRSQLVAGQFHSHGVNTSGTVWSWGYAGNGSLGVGKSWDNRLIPEEMQDFGAIAALSSSYNHTVAVKMDGTVWAWGYIVDGYLGDGSDNTKQWAPVQVRDTCGYLENVSKVAVGWSHSVALKKDGTVWTWGRDHYGQLGNGQQESGIVAEQVAGLTDIVAVAAGGDFTLALDSSGNVWGWGANWSGGLGIGTTTRWSIPVQIPNLPKITAVAAGGYHSLLLDADKRVWASGRNDYGQLGNNSESHSLFFVPLGLENIVEISAGASHSLVLGRDGKVRAWGRNSFGQCGGSVQASQMSPVIVADINNVVHMEAGGNHCLALREDGSIWTWGRNDYGQLGNGARDESDSFNPVPAGINFKLFEGGEVIFDGWEDITIHAVGFDNPWITGRLSSSENVNWIGFRPDCSGVFTIDLSDRSNFLFTVYKKEGNLLKQLTEIITDKYLVSGNETYFLKLRTNTEIISSAYISYVLNIYKKDWSFNTWQEAKEWEHKITFPLIRYSPVVISSSLYSAEDVQWGLFKSGDAGFIRTLNDGNPNTLQKIYYELDGEIRELTPTVYGYPIFSGQIYYVETKYVGIDFIEPISYSLALQLNWSDLQQTASFFYPVVGGILECGNEGIAWLRLYAWMAGSYSLALYCSESCVEMTIFDENMIPQPIENGTVFLERYNKDGVQTFYYAQIKCNRNQGGADISYVVAMQKLVSENATNAPVGNIVHYTLDRLTQFYIQDTIYSHEQVDWFHFIIAQSGHYKLYIQEESAAGFEYTFYERKGDNEWNEYFEPIDTNELGEIAFMEGRDYYMRVRYTFDIPSGSVRYLTKLVFVGNMHESNKEWWWSKEVYSRINPNAFLISGILEYKEDIGWFKIRSNATTIYNMKLTSPKGHPIYSIYELDITSNELQPVTPLSPNRYHLKSGQPYYISVSYDLSKPYINDALYALTMLQDPKTMALSVYANQEYYLPIIAKDAPFINSSQINITYDPTKLKLLDAAAQTVNADTEAGDIPLTDLQITSHHNGNVILRQKSSFESGFVTLLKFKATTSGSALVSLLLTPN